MDPNVEFIEMPLNGERYKRMSDRRKLQFWLNSIIKIFVLILIATLLVILFALSWSLFLNPTNETKRKENNDVPKIIDSHCGSGWIDYKDEKCFQILSDTFQTFDEAVESCAKLGATLPVIHSKEEQDFLANYLFKAAQKDENFWIGSRVVPNNTFRWIDSADLTFTNWVTKGPKAKDNYCVQIQAEEDVFGKWIDEPCKEKNLVVCQKMQSWSIERLQSIVIAVRKNCTDLVDEANRKIQENDKNLFPIGFIYAQLPNETAPVEIWPQMNWTDVSAAYEGVFFRVNGGNAAEFGQVQHENAPRLDSVFTGDMDEDINYLFGEWRRINISIPKIGSSQKIYTGKDVSEGKATSWTLNYSDGEIRPRNMAIRIWKRTG